MQRVTSKDIKGARSYTSLQVVFTKQFFRSRKTARNTLEPAGSLFGDPLDNPGVVVAKAEVVIKSGKAMALTRLLHLVELGILELMVFNHAPVALSTKQPAAVSRVC